MADPVMTVVGHSYERTALEKWLREKDTDPKTNTVLPTKEVFPNHTLRASIAEWKLITVGGATPPSPSGAGPSSQFVSGGIADAEQNVILDVSRITSETYFDERVGKHILTVHCSEQESKEERLLVLSLDKSGSMSAPASKPDGSDQTKLDRLCVAKAAIQTVVESVPSHFSIGLVCWSRDAVIEFPPERMTAEAKHRIKACLKKVIAGGGTNLWKGTKTSFDVCAAWMRTHENSPPAVVMNFTDGEPTLGTCSRGYEASMVKYKADTKTTLPVLYNFAFGTEPNIDILRLLSEETNGRVIQVSDAQFIGTTVVHALANTLSRVGHAILTVYPWRTGSRGAMASTHSIKNGGTVHLLLDFSPRCFVLNLHTASLFCKPKQKVPRRADMVLLRTVACRHKMTHLLTTLLGGHTTTSAALLLKEWVLFSKEMSLDMTNEESQQIASMLEDINGQISMALLQSDPKTGKRFWDTWGKNYILSLHYAHVYEEAHTFIDKSVQSYVYPLMEKHRDAIDTVYADMPAPVPTVVASSPRTCPAASSRSWDLAPSRSMSQQGYYRPSGGGCLSGDSLVLMGDKVIRKPLRLLKKDDKVYDPLTGNAEKIVTVFQFRGEFDLLCIDAHVHLWATEWHPMQFQDKQWEFPASHIQIEKQKMKKESIVWDLMTTGQSFQCGETTVAALGHGLEGDVIGHGFFGSRTVLQTAFPQWGQGHVLHDFQKRPLKRSKVTNTVVGMWCPVIRQTCHTRSMALALAQGGETAI